MLIDYTLRDFATEHPELVNIRLSIKFPELRVVKYHPKVFYKNLWTPELEELRGVVIDRDWNVVVRPFRKIYNRGERNTDFQPDEEVVAVRKINGFMAAMTKDSLHGLIISTTGSLDSDFVYLAEKWLIPISKRGLVEGVTYLFEIVDESDPHIIDEKEGVYLIGCRAVCSKMQLFECDLDSMARGFGVMRPEWEKTKFYNVLEKVKTVQHEGFCVYNMKGESLKIKSPYYLIKKLFMRIKGARLTEEWFWMNRDEFEEEYFPLVDHLHNNKELFSAMDQQTRRKYIEDFLSLT